MTVSELEKKCRWSKYTIRKEIKNRYPDVFEPNKKVNLSEVQSAEILRILNERQTIEEILEKQGREWEEYNRVHNMETNTAHWLGFRLLEELVHASSLEYGKQDEGYAKWLEDFDVEEVILKLLNGCVHGSL